MISGVNETQGSTIAPGWYDDPATPGRDRWWSGTQWTGHTARTPTGWSAMWGVTYTRALRAGANTVLWVARVLVLEGFVGFVLAGAIGSSFDLDVSNPATAGIARVLFGLFALSALVGLALGVIGLTRARRLGGFGLAVYSIVIGALGLLFFVVPLVIAVVARG